MQIWVLNFPFKVSVRKCNNNSGKPIPPSRILIQLLYVTFKQTKKDFKTNPQV